LCVAGTRLSTVDGLDNRVIFLGNSAPDPIAGAPVRGLVRTGLQRMEKRGRVRPAATTAAVSKSGELPTPGGRSETGNGKRGNEKGLAAGESF
jgi:hypothetical protein